MQGSGAQAGRCQWIARALATSTSIILIGCGIGSAAAGAASSTFATKGTGPGQVITPRGIAVDQESGDVYIADPQNGRVDKFGPEGEFLLAWGFGVADGHSEVLQSCTTVCFAGVRGSGAGQLSGVEGIAVDNSLSLSRGDIYVADTGNSRIEKFSAQGEFLAMFGGEVDKTPGSPHPNVCTKENIEEGDECAGGISGEGAGAFEGLTKHAVAVDSAGTVYVGDSNRVQRFSEGGVAQSEVAFPGAGESENLAVDSAKDLYLQSANLPGVRKYDVSGATGVELGEARDEGGYGPRLAISIGPADELLLNDFRLPSGPHHILAFDPEGKESASFDAGGEALDGGQGIAYSIPAKALYILSGSAVRIVTPPPLGPLILEGSEATSAVQPTTATLEGSINPEGAGTEYHFEYGTTTAYGESTPLSGPLDAVNEVQSVSVVATGGTFSLVFGGEASGAIPFNASAAEVQAALEAIPTLGAGQVAVSGEAGGPWSVEFIGTRAGENVPELSAEAGGLTSVEPEPSATVSTTTPGFSAFDDRAVSAAITGLLPGTTYHFRLVATNGTQTTVGPDQTFTTLPPVSIESTSVAEVNDTSARLEAELDPHGLSGSYHFEYDTTPYTEGQAPHGISVPIPDADIGTGAVHNVIQDLVPSTSYYYRVVAQSTLGVSTGPGRVFITQGPSATLSDGRSWELVSPPDKHGAPLEPITEEGGLIQAAPGGGAFAYVAIAPIEAGSKGARSPEDSQLLARRGPGGWTTEEIATPHEEVSVIHLGQLSEYKFFAEDLSAGVVEPVGATPLSSQTSERTPYRREADGEFVPLVTAANVPAGTKFGGEEKVGEGSWTNGVEFLTASPDLGHEVLSSRAVLAPGFSEGFVPTKPSLYELAGGALQLISVLPNGKPAAEEGLPVAVGNNNQDMRGAISAKGDRVFFETGSPGSHLYMRDTVQEKTLLLDQIQPGAAGGAGTPVFQGASEDGSRVLFTDTSQLTARASAQENEPDLYMCEIGESAGQPTCALSDLSVTINPGEAANVLGTVSAIDEHGSHVYFAASGVLTGTANAQGQRAVAGAANMYEFDTATGQVQLVAVLSAEDAPDWNGGESGLSRLTARSSPDGNYFSFMSQRSLTDYDNRDVHSGQADEEVYIYEASSGAVRCVSCDPSGARPLGVFDPENLVIPGLLVDHPRSWSEHWLAGSIPGWTTTGLIGGLYQSRFLSDSGRTFFNASDALVPQDTNKVNDVYQYEPPGVGSCSTASATFSASSNGCVSLISSGGSKEESAFLDASGNGDEVFFLTDSRLSSSDVDGAFDVYDAHVCSGDSPCPPAVSASTSCEGDSCQNPSSPPNDLTPSSLSYKGPANAVPAPPPPAKAKAKPTKAQLLAAALKACKKKKPKSKRLSCERQAHKRYGSKAAKARAKKKARAKRASAKQGRGN